MRDVTNWPCPVLRGNRARPKLEKRPLGLERASCACSRSLLTFFDQSADVRQWWLRGLGLWSTLQPTLRFSDEASEKEKASEPVDDTTEPAVSGRHSPTFAVKLDGPV